MVPLVRDRRSLGGEEEEEPVMETTTLLRVGFFSLKKTSELINSHHSPLLPRTASPSLQIHPRKRSTLLASASSRSSVPENEFGREDIITFLQERQLNGDFVSRVTDMLWKSSNIEIGDSQASTLQQDGKQHNEMIETESDNGLLKLTRTKEWVSGYSAAPASKKVVPKDWQNESDRRKKVDFLKYQALKRELMLLTIGVGAACSVYCLVTLSFQAAISYACGVGFSCLYLQLLVDHTDNVSKESIPEIFMRRKTKKIGIRSEDLKNVLETTLNGTTIALSSPRLVIPAAIYGLWGLSQHFSGDYLDFQLVPGMLGFFAYKAAALVQVYRDNEGLRMIFPDNDGLDNN